MRIVTRAEFMNLPEGTVYQEYDPYVFQGLRIKKENVGDNDFRFVDLCASSFDCAGSDEFEEFLDHAQSTGSNIKLDFSDEQSVRDGLFDDKQLYAVWSGGDVQELIMTLESADIRL